MAEQPQCPCCGALPIDWTDNPFKSNTLQVLVLANELLAALDLEAEDIGGARPSKSIVRDLGPATENATADLRDAGGINALAEEAEADQ